MDHEYAQPLPFKDEAVPRVQVSAMHALVLSAFTGLFLIILFVWWLKKTVSLPQIGDSRSFISSDQSPSSDQESSGPRPRVITGEGPRRRPNTRRLRANRNVAVGRIPATLEQSSQSSGTESSEDLSDSDSHVVQALDESKKKMGVKKQMKLAMKEEKRAAREAMLQEREEKKKKQEILDQMRKVEEEKVKQEEEAQAERERQEREEQLRKEHEDYLKLAASFQVEEEGFDPDSMDNESEGKLAQFVEFIKEQKVVLLEDLAAQFKMRTKDVVDRLQKLLDNGTLVGIIDDRGKFISITNEELESVAKFIRQRGRVSINEIVVNSNRLINLKPEIVET